MPTFLAAAASRPARAATATLAVALTLWGCLDQERPPTAPTSAPAGPSYEIMDGAHSDGLRGFYFLPPIVKAPTTTGAFDGTLAPSVQICAWSGGGCGAVVATFTPATGPGGEKVTVDLTNQLYMVNWHTDQFDLAANAIYRIRVLVAGTELGHADVAVVSGGAQLKYVETNEYIGLVDGRTLPIKFRVERGAVFTVPVTGGTFSTPPTADGGVTLVVPSGALSTSTGLTVEPTTTYPPDGGIVPTAVYDLGPDGSVFATPLAVTIKYDPADVPAGVPEADLRLHIGKKDAAGNVIGWERAAQGTVDVAAHTVTGLVSHFTPAAVRNAAASVWSPQATNTTYSVAYIWGASATNVYAAGFTLAHYDGSAWTEVPATFAVQTDGNPGAWSAIWGSSATNVLLVGTGGAAMKYDGTNRTFLATGTNQHLHGVWGSSATNAWAVGDGGTLLHYNGTAWSSVPLGRSDSLWAVWGSSASNVYAVGLRGTILRYNGSSWSAVPLSLPNPDVNFYAVWGSSPTDIYVGGNSGIMHFNGTTWTQAAFTQSEVRGIWGAGSKDVWAAATDGIYYYDGVQWTRAGTWSGAVGVWGSSRSNVWASAASEPGPVIMHGVP